MAIPSVRVLGGRTVPNGRSPVNPPRAGGAPSIGVDLRPAPVLPSRAMREFVPPRSLWMATAGPAPVLPVLDHAVSSDVAILGGGYTGLSAALHLAERGVDVALLEAAELGHGASGRNNGQVIPHYTTHAPDDVARLLGEERGERLNALVRDSSGLVFELVRRHGIACEAVQNGWVQPAHAPGRFARSRRLFEQWRRRGASVRLVERDEMSAMLGSRVYHGGWLAETGGHVNPLGLARGLGAAAVRAGARLYVKSPALQLLPEDGFWRIGTPGGTLTARRVLLATDAYTGRLWPELARSYVGVRAFQMATAPLGDNLRRQILPGDHAVSDTRGDLQFFRFDRSGRLVTGGGFISYVGAETRAKATRAAILQRIFPVLAEAGVSFDYYWEGQIGITLDRLPRLHRLAPGLFAALGYSGRGVALATALGHETARWLTGTPDDQLAVPVTPVPAIPLHGLATFGARFMRLVYRWRDSRP
jgi:glycine/D-amino acid oxidase-like deaminating enzyme